MSEAVIINSHGESIDITLAGAAEVMYLREEIERLREVQGGAKTVTANLVPRDSNWCLNEAADRAFYFYRQVDGTYRIPTVDPQTRQVLELICTASTTPGEAQREPVKFACAKQENQHHIDKKTKLRYPYYAFIHPDPLPGDHPLWIDLYTAPPPPNVPDGYVLVPVEPTPGMVVSGYRAPPELVAEADLKVIYKAMLNAAKQEAP